MVNYSATRHICLYYSPVCVASLRGVLRVHADCIDCRCNYLSRYVCIYVFPAYIHSLKREQLILFCHLEMEEECPISVDTLFLASKS